MLWQSSSTRMSILLILSGPNQAYMAELDSAVQAYEIGSIPSLSHDRGNRSNCNCRLLILIHFQVTVCTGLLIHGLVVLPLIYFIFIRENPFKFAYKCIQPIMTALGTASRYWFFNT